MDWLTTALPLRLILLGAGLLFIAGLVWFDRQRRHQASGKTAVADVEAVATPPSSVASSHAEPTLATASASAHQPHELSAHRPLPVIDWRALERGQGAADATGPRLAVHAMRSPGRGASDPSLDGDDGITEPASVDGPSNTSSGSTSARDAAAAPVFLGEPSIDHWPPDNGRRICSLRIVPRTGERLPGRVLRHALQGAGFLPGALGIFHYADAEGRALISAANLAQPGQLDPASMDFQRYGGLHLFAVLPGPMPRNEHLHQLFSLSAELAERAGGVLQDERGAVLTETRRHELLREHADLPDDGAAAEPPAA
jgi:FtsZ-interacting cell division protein ZipA